MAVSTIKSSTEVYTTDAFEAKDSRVNIIEQRCILLGNRPVNIYIKFNVTSSVSKWTSIVTAKDNVIWDAGISYTFDEIHDSQFQRHPNRDTGIQNSTQLEPDIDYIITFPY